MNRIFVDPVADRDAADIFRWIAQDDPDAALRVLSKIEQTIRGLADFSTGRLGRIPRTREQVVPGLPYIIIYTVRRYDEEDAVIILHIRHGARMFPSR